MVLLVDAERVVPYLTIEDCIEGVESGFRQWGIDHTINRTRRRIHVKESLDRQVRMSHFAAALPETGVMGTMVHANGILLEKGLQIVPPHQGCVVTSIYSTKDAHNLAIIVGRQRGSRSSTVMLRTSATAAVGTKYLARKGARVMGLFGSQYYAKSVATFMGRIRDIQKVKVYSPNPAHRKEFCEKMSRIIGVDMIPCDLPSEPVENTDLLVLATNSNVPVYDGRLLQKGTHVTTGLGSNAPELGIRRREIDDETVHRSDLFVVSNKEQAVQDDQGDIVEPVERGITSWEKIYELAQVIVGRAPSRTDDRQITLFNHNGGQGVADIGLMAKIYQVAKEHGIGVEIDLREPPEELLIR